MRTKMTSTSRTVLVGIATAVYLMLSVLTGCTKAGSNANAGASDNNTPQPPSATASAVPEPSVAENGAKYEPSLVSLAAGAYPVKKLHEYSGAYDTMNLMDERPRTTWTSPEGEFGPDNMVLSLPEQTVLKNIIFD